MSLRVQLLSQYAKSPYANRDGTYDIYSADEDKVIPARQMSSVNIDIAIAPPNGFHALIFDCEIAAKFKVSTIRYTSSDEFENRIEKLMIYLQNNSSINYTVERGSVVGKILLVRYRTFALEIVEDINDRITGREVLEPKIKSMANSSAVWWKRLYRDNPADTKSKYLADQSELLKKINEFRESDNYKSAFQKENVEANYIWRELPNDLKIRINDDYMNIRQKITTGEPAVSDDEKDNFIEVDDNPRVDDNPAPLTKEKPTKEKPIKATSHNMDGSDDNTTSERHNE